MSDTSAILDALHGIASRLDDDMSEKDVENSFLNENFYTVLGYEGAGHDLRSEWTLPDNRRPDYVTLDNNESVTAVYEFKTTDRDLGPHEDQLFHYVEELKADYGVLTNGDEIRLYRRDGRTRLLTISPRDATGSDAADLEAALEKPEWDITDPESVTAFLSRLDEVELDGELGREHFFETFRLEEDSPFADLVTAMMDLLEELRDEQEAKFVKGAYDFWEASYASTPDETPDSWEPFVNGRQSLHDFMFCLESGHALLARLLLAKATDDHDFFPNSKGLRRYFDELGGFGGNIDRDAYPVAANGMIEDMRNQLVQSLFEDDIFIWWTDGYGEQTASQHDNPYNRFRDVAKEGSDVSRVSPATRERFSRAIAHVSFAVLKFDFSHIEGDPLGNLYQRYFDPETRKALGEFYTPQPVVNYIINGVDYNVGVSQERLIDPSCGSGTFLVEAVNRYLEDVRRYNDDPDWSGHLTELCTRPHIVGLDIHPFAVLMAQIRFMVAILPEYRDAKRETEDFTIRRLPIFRTDSLRNERELTGIDLGDEGQTQMTLDSVTEDSQDVKIPVPLPIEVEEGEVTDSELDDGFLVQRVRMPKYDTAKINAGVRNFGEYYAALQGVLDVVKFHMREGWWEYGGGLKEGIHRYTTREYEGIEEFFEPYVDDILGTVRYLREDHGDGRLFKMFEDTVLSLVVKNYMTYDYVVGNPPYVRIQRVSDSQQAYINQLYRSTDGAYDLYYLFYERGIDMLADEGKLGYITPSQFMMAEDGENLRNIIRNETRIKEVFNFRGAGVFEDALNYPAIVLLQNGSETANNNYISCIRVRADYSEAPDDLGERIMTSATESRKSTRYTDSNVDVFRFPQSELTDGDWTLMPPKEYEVFKKLGRKSDRTIEEITDAVFQGLRTGANGIFIVEPVNANRIPPEAGGDTIMIQPTGSEQTYEIESDLLCPWLERDSFRRWEANWGGKHLLIPYNSENELISADILKEDLPLTWKYLNSHRDELESREGGTLENSDNWYKLARPQNLSRFQKPKLIGKEFSDSAQFIPDDGNWHFASGYGIALKSSYSDKSNFTSGYINSNISEYYLKHISSIKSFSPIKAYYAYRTRYINQIPFISSESGNRVSGSVYEIRRVLKKDTKTRRFPEAYLGEFTGDLEYIEYEWQTRRYPVKATIQELGTDRFTVTAGRSDEITDPLMDRGDSKERKLRSQYVHAAVDGRNVKKGEEQTIPIPQSQDGVEQLIEALESDRQTVEEASVEDLEAEIDQTVYDLFDLTDEEREVIEDYLEVF
ncbi:Eco57I restriction-modification methylase domain-containing protein [Natronomonas sp. LN261]|uniref:Eco57I restriction-modification methylase domain-containing protein n=1 Tax=Natronomonas sp. LN261 TaxID=2750669 RepID=UPI0015EF1F3D|nr:N-6 DNA methylase [Natronomonas sp. LN261]